MLKVPVGRADTRGMQSRRTGAMLAISAAIFAIFAAPLVAAADDGAGTAQDPQVQTAQP